MLKETKRTLSKFISELEDVVILLQKEDSEEIELILEEKFKGEIEDWMEIVSGFEF